MTDCANQDAFPSRHCWQLLWDNAGSDTQATATWPEGLLQLVLSPLTLAGIWGAPLLCQEPCRCPTFLPSSVGKLTASLRDQAEPGPPSRGPSITVRTSLGQVPRSSWPCTQNSHLGHAPHAQEMLVQLVSPEGGHRTCALDPCALRLGLHAPRLGLSAPWAPVCPVPWALVSHVPWASVPPVPWAPVSHAPWASVPPAPCAWASASPAPGPRCALQVVGCVCLCLPPEGRPG